MIEKFADLHSMPFGICCAGFAIVNFAIGKTFGEPHHGNRLIAVASDKFILEDCQHDISIDFFAKKRLSTD
jgi:hypothetical protein